MLATQLTTAVRHTPVHMATSKAYSQTLVMNNYDLRSMQRIYRREQLHAKPTVCRGTLQAAVVTSESDAGNFKLLYACSCDRAENTNGRVFYGMASVFEKPDHLLQSLT